MLGDNIQWEDREPVRAVKRQMEGPGEGSGKDGDVPEKVGVLEFSRNIATDHGIWIISNGKNILEELVQV